MLAQKPARRGLVGSTKKPRKKYKPKPVEVLPVTYRHQASADVYLQLIPHSELEKLRTATADEGTFHTLAYRLNWGYVLAGECFPEQPEVRAQMEKALAAISSVKNRFERTGKYGCTGEEFFTLGNSLNLTDEMQEATTRRQQRDAAELVFKINELKQKGEP